MEDKANILISENQCNFSVIDKCKLWRVAVPSGLEGQPQSRSRRIGRHELNEEFLKC